MRRFFQLKETACEEDVRWKQPCSRSRGTEMQAGEVGRNLMKQGPSGPYYFGPHNIAGGIEGFKTW